MKQGQKPLRMHDIVGIHPMNPPLPDHERAVIAVSRCRLR